MKNRTKITNKIMTALLCASFITFPSEKALVVQALEVTTEAVHVGTISKVMDWTDSPKWETFGNQYGSDWPTTYQYDKDGFSGELKAVQIMAVPVASSKKDLYITRAPIQLTDSLERNSGYRGGPYSPFPDTVTKSVYDPIFKVNRTFVIPKSGIVIPEDKASKPVAYPSRGHIFNARAGSERSEVASFYGLLGNSATYDYRNRRWDSLVPDSEHLPYDRFYGEFRYIQDTNYILDTATPYFDPLTGTNERGMRYADSAVYKGDWLSTREYTPANSDMSEHWGYNGSQILTKFPEGYGWYSQSQEKWRTEVQTLLKTGPGNTSTTLKTIPKGTSYEVSFTKDGWHYISYGVDEKQPDGTVKKVYTTGYVDSKHAKIYDPGNGNNPNIYRRGLTVLYQLTNYHTTYTQNYSGQAQLPDYYDKSVGQEWDIYVIYKGDAEDVRLDNFKATDLKATPTFTNIFPGSSSAVGKVKIDFTISHEAKNIPLVSSYNPIVDVYMGSTLLWRGNVSVASGGLKNHSITVDSLTVPEGNNTISVEVNPSISGSRKYTERIPKVTNPYTDNKTTAMHLGYKLKLNNIRVSDVTVNPIKTEISPGDSSAKNTLKVTYTVTHEMDSTPGSPPISVPMEIKLGNTMLWFGSDSVPQNGSVTRTRTFNNVTVPMGANTVKVEANRTRVITELKPGVSNPYADNIGTAIHSGTEPDTNNFTVTYVKGLPINAQISPEETSVKQSLTVNFTINHALSAVPGNAQLNPMIYITLGGTRIWSGTVGMEPGGNINRSVTIDNLVIPIGNHQLSVEVNGDRALPEKLPNNGFAYLDNTRSISYPAVRWENCDLPVLNSKRTSNTWSERWTKTTFSGVLEGPAGNQLYRLSGRTVSVSEENYSESYEIVDMYFRSKWTRDMHKAGYAGYNALGHIPGRDIGWVKMTDDRLVKIKAGYAFEVIALTRYETTRWQPFMTETSGPSYTGPNGPGVSGFTSVTPKITPTNNPEVLYINMNNGMGGGVCSIMTKTKDEGDWYSSTKTFELPEAATINGVVERRIYTNVGGKAGVYDVTISTPRPDRPNAFRGYEAEAPVVTANKGYLHDYVTFRLEVIGQDDLKSHIVQ